MYLTPILPNWIHSIKFLKKEQVHPSKYFLSRSSKKKTRVSSQVSNFTIDCKLFALRYDIIHIWSPFLHRVPKFSYFNKVESPMEVRVFTQSHEFFLIMVLLIDLSFFMHELENLHISKLNTHNSMSSPCFLELFIKWSFGNVKDEFMKTCIFLWNWWKWFKICFEIEAHMLLMLLLLKNFSHTHEIIIVKGFFSHNIKL